MVKQGIVNALKDSYQEGARVRLIEMDDSQAPPEGTEGTVMFVDDMGTIHVAWDNGSTLGIVYRVDRCVKI